MAVYTAYLRWRPRELDQLTFAGAAIAIGAVALAPLHLWEAASAAPVEFSPGVVAAIAYIGVFPSVLATLFWNKAVADVGANRAAQFLNLVPEFGISLAIVFLDETLERFHLAGAAVIVAGIALATAGARRNVNGV
jgi:drug/metabolite transporter (DMT)-like permease